MLSLVLYLLAFLALSAALTWWRVSRFERLYSLTAVRSRRSAEPRGQRRS